MIVAGQFPLGTIWERPHRGELIRFSVVEHGGTRYAELRRFYLAAGEWKHGKKGCTVPLCALFDLQAALAAYLARNAPADTLA
jgi:hypothetical protein